MSPTNDNNSTTPNTVPESPAPRTPAASIGIQAKPSLKKSAKRRKLVFDDADKTDDKGNCVPLKTTSYVALVIPKKCKYEITGAAIVPTEKYADSLVTAPLFLPGNDDRKTEYVNSVDVLKRVVSIKKMNGVTIGSMGNGKFWPTRSLAMTLPEGWGSAEVCAHLNDTIYPNMKTYFANHKTDPTPLCRFWLKDNQYPYVINPQDADHVWTAEVWSDVFVNWDDIVFCIHAALREVAEAQNIPVLTLKQWLEMDKKHIYTLFHEGQVPHDFIKQKGLTMNHMKAVDYDAYLLKESEAATAKKAAADKKPAATV